MKNPLVLICDDNISVHKSLEGYLHERGIDTISVYDGEAAMSKLRSCHIDLVVLDIMLPGIGGMELLRKIKKDSNVAVIILSAKDGEIDRVLGLELGADDYVTKPFSPREVAIRIKKLLNRINGSLEVKKMCIAELTVIVDSYEVYVNDTRIDMSPREVELLSYMIYNAGKVLSREMILNAVWGIEYVGDTRCVDTQIKRIRQKLPSQNVHFAIRSIYGIGYKLEQTL